MIQSASLQKLMPLFVLKHVPLCHAVHVDDGEELSFSYNH